MTSVLIPDCNTIEVQRGEYLCKADIFSPECILYYRVHYFLGLSSHTRLFVASVWCLDFFFFFFFLSLSHFAQLPVDTLISLPVCHCAICEYLASSTTPLPDRICSLWIVAPIPAVCDSVVYDSCVPSTHSRNLIHVP